MDAERAAEKAIAARVAMIREQLKVENNRHTRKLTDLHEDLKECQRLCKHKEKSLSPVPGPSHYCLICGKEPI